MKTQYNNLQSEIDAAVFGVLQNGSYILGPNVRDFEAEMARYVGVEHAIGVASGTDAISLSLRAMGVGYGDEVIVPAFTFFGTAGAAMLLGANPVLVDIDPQTYCIDPGQLEGAITPKTKAIIPVHLFGHPADMDPILAIADKYNIRVLEDNAQAIGASYKGKMTGGIGDVGCLSFYPTKNLGAYGDGGMILTNDDSIANKARMLRTHGWSKEKYYPEMIGYNSRLDEIQAAILRIKLPYLDSWNESRRSLVRSYGELLEGTDLTLPTESDDCVDVFHMYVLEIPNRDHVAKALWEAGVATSVYYPYPLHLVPAWPDVNCKLGDYPVSERAAEHCLAIPLYPDMTVDQVQHVAHVLRTVLSGESL